MVTRARQGPTCGLHQRPERDLHVCGSHRAGAIRVHDAVPGLRPRPRRRPHVEVVEEVRDLVEVLGLAEVGGQGGVGRDVRVGEELGGAVGGAWVYG